MNNKNKNSAVWWHHFALKLEYTAKKNISLSPSKYQIRLTTSFFNNCLSLNPGFMHVSPNIKKWRSSSLSASVTCWWPTVAWSSASSHLAFDCQHLSSSISWPSYAVSFALRPFAVESANPKTDVLNSRTNLREVGLFPKSVCLRSRLVYEVGSVVRCLCSEVG